MDLKLINPVIDAFSNIMPMLGFSKINNGQVIKKNRNINSQGVVINLGIVGDIKGNIIYVMTIENAKKIASCMMMGLPVNELDDMAQSAVSELANMITANAGISFSNLGFNVNISTPALMYGEEFQIKMNTDNVLSTEIYVDDIPIEINIAFDKI